MNIKRIKGEETKRKIMNVSEILFSEKGFDKTSVRDICEKAEISKGAFFHHFPTKEELFLEILEKYLFSLDEEMEKIEKNTKNTLLAMDKMIEILDKIFLTSKGKFTIFLEFLRKASKNEEIMKRLREKFKKYGDYVVNLIEKGKKQSKIKEDIDSIFLSQLILSIAVGLIFKKTLFLSEKDKDFSKKEFYFILNNIRKEESL